MAGPAFAHEFQVVVLEPSDDWCERLHTEAHASDVVELSPGVYPGGCDLTLGGDVALNEALFVTGTDFGEARISADENGLSLRVSGEPTRLYHLVLDGRLEVAANGVTVDSVALQCVEVDPGVEKFTLLFSEVASLSLDLDNTVVRGNRLVDLTVAAATGLVADNVIYGSLESTIPTHRNLVMGDLGVASDAFANVVLGATDVTGRLYGNTLFGAVTSSDARNNLTTAAALDEESGNLLCADCVTPFDVRPTGEAFDVVPVEATGQTGDYCNQPPTVIGAVGALDFPDWTAFDRDHLGCIAGTGADVPEAPEGSCERPMAPAPRAGVEVVSKGCSTVPASSWPLLALGMVLLLPRRSR